MTTSPTIAYPTNGVPQGVGLGVTETLNPDITWNNGDTMTWTTGAVIEWIGTVETTPDLSAPHSTHISPTIAYTGIGEA